MSNLDNESDIVREEESDELAHALDLQKEHSEKESTVESPDDVILHGSGRDTGVGEGGLLVLVKVVVGAILAVEGDLPGKHECVDQHVVEAVHIEAAQGYLEVADTQEVESLLLRCSGRFLEVSSHLSAVNPAVELAPGKHGDVYSEEDDLEDQELHRSHGIVDVGIDEGHQKSGDEDEGGKVATRGKEVQPQRHRPVCCLSHVAAAAVVTTTHSLT